MPGWLDEVLELLGLMGAAPPFLKPARALLLLVLLAQRLAPCLKLPLRKVLPRQQAVLWYAQPG